MNTIAKYNDLIRKSLLNPAIKRQLDNEGCRYQVTMTANAHHSIKNKIGLQHTISTFNNFNEDNDPYGEHDFINFTFQGHKVIGKFSYYDENLEYGSEDPEDLTKTTRVFSIMLASDY